MEMNLDDIDQADEDYLTEYYGMMSKVMMCPILSW
jgi:hypothetical protein